MDDRMYRQMAAVESRHWWFVARRQRVAQLLARLPRARLALDAGCGSGGNLALLAGHADEVVGFEPDARALELARERSAAWPIVGVHEGSLPGHIPTQGRGADLILCLDVLEHVEDDAAAARALLGHCAPGGHLVLTVPAHPSLFGPHDRLHHHWRRYTRARLCSVLAGAGWEIVEVGWFNGLVGWAAVPVRLWARRREGQGQAVGLEGQSIPRGNRLVIGAMAVERWLAARRLLPWGLSLVVVARRPRVATP